MQQDPIDLSWLPAPLELADLRLCEVSPLGKLSLSQSSCRPQQTKIRGEVRVVHWPPPEPGAAEIEKARCAGNAMIDPFALPAPRASHTSPGGAEPELLDVQSVVLAFSAGVRDTMLLFSNLSDYLSRANHSFR